MNTRFRPASRNIIETILVLLLLLALLLALYDVLKIFFGVLTFALIFSVSFHQLFERFAGFMRGRRKLAAVIYAIALTAVIALPLTYIISTLSTHVRGAVEWISVASTEGLPALPAWITNIPFVGSEIVIFWQHLKESPKETISVYEPQIRMVLHHMINSGAGIIGVAFQLVIGIVISAFLLVSGDKAVQPLRSTIQHLLGRKDGSALLSATTQAVKGVAIGVMGTAFIAAIIAWVGLTIAGIPFALGLSALIFFLVVIQIGPLVVWIPLTIWMAMQGHTGMTVFLIIYGILMVAGEAVLKPLLIAKSGKLPFLVLFLGVIGGLAAWGFAGMFKGAIIVAVFYTVFNSWLEKKDVASPAE
ncbi:putative PurR-regulated permease PerM [Chitinophaga niastensis]|uniref:Putative PurR-regulated permease PerM n=1 Tax=Chitinophaga niastensis TaxID=536980 RepID=A0A2P8H9I1_CHINA|nr:AI-2E family transporter [Chitinophaga niastensis]PSL42882.1 putative PurR-regulated permease PerM [Chitinophaga niastensis]